MSALKCNKNNMTYRTQCTSICDQSQANITVDEVKRLSPDGVTADGSQASWYW